MTIHPNLLPDAFAGTAAAYARFRPPYPKALLSDLLARAGVPPEGRLLDLACGPGRVALDLAGSFATVWAIDLEPEMIEVGRREAARRDIDNVTWLAGRAEDLAAPAAMFDLTTVGEAFHRLDQTLIADKAMSWLKPGGRLATLGGEGLLDGREPWQAIVAEVARRWMARAFPAGWGVARAGAVVGRRGVERLLRSAGFIDVGSRSFSEPRDWTFEDVLGYLQSTSVCSRKALGANFEAFEADLRAALSAEAESLTFHGSLRWGYTLARKPH
jgi:SAM-dependent methyltransferase